MGEEGREESGDPFRLRKKGRGGFIALVQAIYKSFLPTGRTPLRRKAQRLFHVTVGSLRVVHQRVVSR